jgi:16S rRNA processing protein RimM
MKDTVLLGEIVKPHGIKGSVKVNSYAESPESFVKMKNVILRDKSGMEKTYQVEHASKIGNKVILSFSGIRSRNDAEDLVGSQIAVTREMLPLLEDGEFYWCDLLGMEVYDTSGMYYGIIEHIFQTGSNDVYVVRGDNKKETLVPATYDAVAEICVSENKMTIFPL